VANGILAQNIGVDETPPFTATNVSFVQYVSTTDRTDNFYVRFQLHTTFDANGEPTAVFITDYSECRG
jgi:hypothetical protein